MIFITGCASLHRTYKWTQNQGIPPCRLKMHYHPHHRRQYLMTLCGAESGQAWNPENMGACARGSAGSAKGRPVTHPYPASPLFVQTLLGFLFSSFVYVINTLIGNLSVKWKRYEYRKCYCTQSWHERQKSAHIEYHGNLFSWWLGLRVHCARHAERTSRERERQTNSRSEVVVGEKLP